MDGYPSTGIREKKIMFKHKKMIIAYVLSLLLAACTSVHIKTSDGVDISYIDIHPMGATQTVDAKWEGVGSVATDRTQEGAEKIIGEVGNIVDTVTGPLR